jgi:hypothetical protein
LLTANSISVTAAASVDVIASIMEITV